MHLQARPSVCREPPDGASWWAVVAVRAENLEAPLWSPRKTLLGWASAARICAAVLSLIMQLESHSRA
jgi:hypothetical protein